MSGDIPAEVIDDINLLRYREKLHLSYEQVMQEPNEEIERALIIWSLDAQRATIEAARNSTSA